MTTFARLAVALTALASLLGLATATAGAVTWHNSGSTAYTATAGPVTLSIGANNLACSGFSGSGTSTGTSTTTSTIGKGTLVASPCSLVGQNTFVHCVTTGTASAFSGGVTTGAADVTCDVRLTAAPANSLCHISGSTGGIYTNPSGTTRGRFTASASTTLVVTNGNVSCPLGTGNGSLTEGTATITTGTPTTLGPIVSRTP